MVSNERAHRKFINEKRVNVHEHTKYRYFDTEVFVSQKMYGIVYLDLDNVCLLHSKILFPVNISL